MLVLQRHFAWGTCVHNVRPLSVYNRADRTTPSGETSSYVVLEPMLQNDDESLALLHCTLWQYLPPKCFVLSFIQRSWDNLESMHIWSDTARFSQYQCRIGMSCSIRRSHVYVLRLVHGIHRPVIEKRNCKRIYPRIRMWNLDGAVANRSTTYVMLNTNLQQCRGREMHAIYL